MLNIDKERKETRTVVTLIIIIICSIVFTVSNVYAERQLPGDLIWTTISNLPGSRYFPHGVAVDRSGVYIVGYTESGTCWKMERRSIIDGSLIWSQTNTAFFIDTAKAVAVDSSGVYIVGTDMRGLRNTHARMRSYSCVDKIVSARAVHKASTV